MQLLPLEVVAKFAMMITRIFGVLEMKLSPMLRFMMCLKKIEINHRKSKAIAGDGGAGCSDGPPAGLSL